MVVRYLHSTRFLAVLVIGLVLAACVRESAGSPAVVPSQAPSTPAATEAPAATAAPSLFASLPQGRTAEGYYMLGKPDAPITIELYSDFL